MLGRGSFGRVYQVELNGKVYALKVCEAKKDPLVEKIDKELMTSQKIDYHANILKPERAYKWEKKVSKKYWVYRYFLMQKV